MEKLLLKKHRRTPVEQIGPASLVTSPQLSLIDSSNLMDEEELCLTADEVEEHEYCSSLFDDEQPHAQLHYNETVLSISEIDDDIKQQIEETDCYEVEEATEIVKDETSAYVNSTCSSSPSVEISTSLTEGSPEVSYVIPELHYTEGVPSHSLTTTNVKNSEETLSVLGGKTSGTNADLSSSQNGSTKTERRTRISPRGPKQRNKTERKCSAKSENTRSALDNISLLISGVNNLPEDKSLSSEDGVENNHPISTGNNNNCMDIGFTTKPSMALQEIAHMKNPDVKHYCGLDGFFTMGLDPAQLDPDTFTPCTTYRAKDTTLNYSTGSADWRPGSSLSEYADKLLVSNVITSSQRRPSSSLSHKIIPKRLTSPRYYQTSAGNTPVSPRPVSASRLTQSALAPKPNYTEARPMSRAALEISEIQSIDCTGKEDPDLENQADLSALKCLEDEFKMLRNNKDEEMYALKIKEYAFKKEDGLELRKTAIPSRSWDAEGHTDEEEEILRDKQNVMSLP
ncbi:uncharacterized protein zbbx [Erpetoichthys calabaricus]|uniref:uncharacterized protein zbbx n=1 Tax=Erpetoichthys calabaricus TaxID=27687 RepID=UPI0022344278|nr:uncharacterized protein zbbx [Erpetoichthys calabaricus]